MRHAIGKYSRDFIMVLLLAVIAGVVGVYILIHERVRIPFFQTSTFQLKAQFSTAQAVTPGQGQTVRVSGVEVGSIAGTSLHNGIATITVNMLPEYKGLVHTNATAFLRPKTGLKDMFIELTPGDSRAPAAKPGWTIPIQNTLPDINPDEVLAALDGDTRDYLKLLVSGLGQGLNGRGGDLRQVLARFEPTFYDLKRINGRLSKRHRNLSHLIHVLNQLNAALAAKGPELAQLISSSSVVFHAFAIEQANLSRAVSDFPGALEQATTTLGKVQTYANVLGPTVEHLRPFARDLTPANRATIPFARTATPIIRNQIRPFVRDARPLVRNLKPAAANLAQASPFLTRSFVVLNHLFNMLGFNPNGREGPTVANRDEGLLFWLAWLGHNGDAVFASADAHGPFRALTQTTTCTTLQDEIAQQPTVPLEFLQGLTGVLTNLCGGSGVLPPVPNIPLPHSAHGARDIVTKQAVQTLRLTAPALRKFRQQSGRGQNGSLPGTQPGDGTLGSGGPVTETPNGGGQGAGGQGGTGPSGPLGVLLGAAGKGH
jgi:phospholipid/cholesterol/gamma-HCH transport system substrate-binding protein